MEVPLWTYCYIYNVRKFNSSIILLVHLYYNYLVVWGIRVYCLYWATNINPYTIERSHHDTVYTDLSTPGPIWWRHDVYQLIVQSRIISLHNRKKYVDNFNQEWKIARSSTKINLIWNFINIKVSNIIWISGQRVLNSLC